jgi:hypothetical protein
MPGEALRVGEIAVVQHPVADVARALESVHASVLDLMRLGSSNESRTVPALERTATATVGIEWSDPLDERRMPASARNRRDAAR